MNYLQNTKKLIQNLHAEYKKWHELDVTDELLNDKDFWKFEKGCATRQASGDVLNKLTSFIPNLMGGSADLAPSNKSDMKNTGYLLKRRQKWTKYTLWC